MKTDNSTKREKKLEQTVSLLRKVNKVLINKHGLLLKTYQDALTKIIDLLDENEDLDIILRKYQRSNKAVDKHTHIKKI